MFAAWELDVFGRLRRLTEASRADLLASEEGRRFAVLSLISAVASGYIALRTLDSQVDVARRTLKTRENALTIFEATGTLSVWVTRLTQFVVAGAFAVGMMTLLWPAAPGKGHV